MSEAARRDFFAGKTALVTGGTSGIGKQIAEDLAALGARVTVCSDNPEQIEAARAAFAEHGLDIATLACDIRDLAQIEATCAAVLERHGHLDILINNAGYGVYRAFEESSLEEILDLADVNLLGAMRMAKVVLPAMIARRSGRIVNISSIGGELIITPNATYCAAKHGMVAWTRALRYEVRRFGLSAHVVCPDRVPTNFQAHPTFRRRARHRKRVGGGMPPSRVSRATLDAIVRDRAVTSVPRSAGLAVWFSRAAPWLFERFWGRMTERRIEQLYAEIEREKEGIG